MTQFIGGNEGTIVATIAAVLIAFALLHGENRPAGSSADLLKEADSSFDARNFARASELYQYALERATQEQDVSTQIEALSQIARCHLTQNQSDSAREWLAEAEKVAMEKYPSGWARYLGVKGRFEWREGRSENAAEIFKQMYSFSREQSLSLRAIDACRMLAIVGTPEEQLEWGLRGIEESEKAGMLENLPSLWNNLAVTYCDIADYSKAHDAFVKAREYHWRFGNEISKLYADYHVGYSLRLKGEYEAALKWLRPVLAWAERLGEHSAVGQACQDIGEVHIALGDTASGLSYLQRAFAELEKAGYSTNNPEALAELQRRIDELAR